MAQVPMLVVVCLVSLITGVFSIPARAEAPIPKPTPTTTCLAELEPGNLGYGVTTRDKAQGTAYLMWSAADVKHRFKPSPPPPSAHNFIAVVWDGKQWLYDNNSRLHPFTTRPTDCLIATLDLTTNTATPHTPNTKPIHGIDTAPPPNLTIKPDTWNNKPNPDEYGLQHVCPAAKLTSHSLREGMTEVTSLHDAGAGSLEASLITGGADASLLEVRNGRLEFTVPPDFEAPKDADLDGVYEVEIGHPADPCPVAQQIEVVVVDDQPAKRFAASLNAKLNAAALGDSDQTIVAGSFDRSLLFDHQTFTSNGGSDSLLASYSSAGQPLWARAFGSTGRDGLDAIALSSTGEIFAVGSFAQTVDFDPLAGVEELTSAGGQDIFLVKFSGEGELLWARTFGGPGNDGERLDLAVDSADRPYIIGTFTDSITLDSQLYTAQADTASFVLGLTSSGQQRWARVWDGPGDVQATAIAIGESNQIAVVGAFTDSLRLDPTRAQAKPDTSTSSNSDAFVAALTNDGNFLWGHAIGGRGSDEATDVAIGNAETTVVGSFSAPLDLDPGPGANLAAPVGRADAFIVSFDSQGTARAGHGFGGPGNDTATAIAKAPNGSSLLGGSFTNSITLPAGANPLELTSKNEQSLFVAKFDVENDVIWGRSLEGKPSDRVEQVVFDDYERPHLISQSARGSTITKWGRNPFAVLEQLGGEAPNGVAFDAYRHLTQAEIDKLANGPYGGFSYPGFTDVATRADNGPHQQGQFRIGCDWSHISYDDPIIKPDQPGSFHAHLYWGNTDVTAFTTPARIGGGGADLLNSGGSTCQGNVLNRSGYWMPAMYSGPPSVDRTFVIPNNILLYYKSKYPEQVQVFPFGITLMSSGPMATSFEPSPHLHWGCYVASLGQASLASISSTIPTDCFEPGEACPTGRCDIQATIAFPQCLNGKTTSIDFVSHSVLLESPELPCPSSHPIRVPQITYLLRWASRPAAEVSQWRLSSDLGSDTASPPFPGGSLHGDWFGAWHEPTNQAWLDGCFDPGPNSGSNNFDGPRNCSLGQTGANETNRSLVRVSPLNNTTGSGYRDDPCQSCFVHALDSHHDSKLDGNN